MKLTNGNRAFLSLFTLLFGLGGCRHINERQMASGKWQFIEVLNHDTTLFPILHTDFLELKSDSTFHYEITLANKNMSGKWQYQKHQLILNYNFPDTTRVYDIEILSIHDFVFNEGLKHFVLKRLE